MKSIIFFFLNFLLFYNGGNFPIKTKSTYPPKHHQSLQKGLFDSDEILNITLKGNIRQLLNDRTDKAEYYPLTLTYTNGDSNEISIPIKAKTRGHFRRLEGNCTYPPLLLDFADESTQTSSFFPQKTALKLVMPCRGEKFVIREWLVYKLYNLVTPQSFRGRLVKVKLVDEKNKKMPSPFYGIILEEEHQMATRNNDIILKEKIRPQEIMPYPFLRMAVFEYMVGNTDWSVEFLQNIRLIAPDSLTVPVPVPYDFDQAGIVDAPYAKPAEELRLSSVQLRRYRGYCMKDMKLFDSTISLYNRLRNDIYKTYTDCSLLDAKYIKETVKFLDQFYSTINNPKALKKEFEYPCDPNGTGNVIIKGLKGD